HLLFLVYLGYPAALIWLTIVAFPIRITHLWSLSVEEQYYMLWSWLIRRLQTPRSILTFCGVLGVTSLISRVVFPGWAYASLPCRADDLAFGAGLAVLFRHNLWRYCQRFAWLLFLSSAGIVILICVLRDTTDHRDRVISMIGFSVIGIAYGALL